MSIELPPAGPDRDAAGAAAEQGEGQAGGHDGAPQARQQERRARARQAGGIIREAAVAQPQVSASTWEILDQLRLRTWVSIQ